MKDSGIEKISMSPEGRKDRIIRAIEQLLVRGSALRPLVLAIEDLHWADKATEDALRWLLEVVPGARILALFTYRPEFIPSWGGRSYHSQITLNRLSNRESLLLVSNLLGDEKIDPELQELLLTKTEGNPFFIEEFVKALQNDPHATTVPGEDPGRHHGKSGPAPRLCQGCPTGRVGHRAGVPPRARPPSHERNGTRFFLAMNHRIYADFFQRQGDRTKAQESLGKAV